MSPCIVITFKDLQSLSHVLKNILSNKKMHSKETLVPPPSLENNSIHEIGVKRFLVLE